MSGSAMHNSQHFQVQTTPHSESFCQPQVGQSARLNTLPGFFKSNSETLNEPDYGQIISENKLLIQEQRKLNGLLPLTETEFEDLWLAQSAMS